MSDEPPMFGDGILADVEGFASGSRIAGYMVLEQIGRGGMAVVYLAVDDRLARRVALKLLVPSLARNHAFRQRFVQESRAAAATDDPHIIPIFEAGEANGLLFIAMRYVSGGDMLTNVRRGGPLLAPRAAAILSPVASALDAAHARGLVHRDVKPANMLIDVRPGRPDHVYLTDFGLSKDAMSGAPGLTVTGQFLGTPDYMPPEQITGHGVDGRTDQYALACAAFELLSGSPPFQRDHGMAVIHAQMTQSPPSLASARPGIPQAADAVLIRALAKNPADRFPSCQDFTESLRAALRLPPYDPEPATSDTSLPDGADTRAAPPAWWQAPRDDPAASSPMAGLATRPEQSGGPARASVDQLPPGPTSWRRRAAVAAAAVAVLVAGGIGISALRHHAPPPPPLAPLPGFLDDVAAISARDAWAVGSRCNYGCVRAAATDRQLILRMNGSGWRPVGPFLREHVVLRGITAKPGGSIWAVGYSCTSSCRTTTRTLILRWNGTTWSGTRAPSPGQSAELLDVTAGPGNTAWAVGSYSASGVERTLILHWTRSRWSQVPSPNPGSQALLNGVSVGPGDTAWAVGSYCARCGTTSAVHQPLILHWKGGAWSQMPISGPSSELYAVSAGSGKTAWAVGYSCTSGCGGGSAVDRTLILRWNGTMWSTAASPSPFQSSSALYDVSAGSGGSAWAAGSSCTSGCGTSSAVRQTLILRWNGIRWSRVPSPSSGQNVALYSISAGPGDSAWAAGHVCTSGYRTSSETDRTLILRWNGTAWVPG